VIAPQSALTGYRRADGRFGVRNHVLVMPVSSGANFVAAKCVEGNDAVGVSHEWLGEGDLDEARIKRTLIGFVTNPNVSGVLVVGVVPEDEWLAEDARRLGQDVRFVSLLGQRGTAQAIEAGRGFVTDLQQAAAKMHREPMMVSDLCLGLECGGSDGLSGITANPALGVASDLIVDHGGISILAEIPELIGAEHILARRAISAVVAARVLSVIESFEQQIMDLGVDVRGAQPTPGNQAGGLTTIEEKSLGAAKKGGAAKVSGVLEYSERPAVRGLHIMDTPGQDIEQMVAMVAAGAQIVAFTTGRGTPTGSPIAPCLKISTNTEIFQRLQGDIDLDAGLILTGERTVSSMGQEIFDFIIEIASGRLTSTEVRGNAEFAISRTSYPVGGLYVSS
jgi:altronate dehydratase large subunit